MTETPTQGTTETGTFTDTVDVGHGLSATLTITGFGATAEVGNRMLKAVSTEAHDCAKALGSQQFDFSGTVSRTCVFPSGDLTYKLDLTFTPTTPPRLRSNKHRYDVASNLDEVLSTFHLSVALADTLVKDTLDLFSVLATGRAISALSTPNRRPRRTSSFGARSGLLGSWSDPGPFEWQGKI